MVTELVLEPLQEHSVAAAVGQDPRKHEARQPTGSLREDQEDVAHGRRVEPIVTGQTVTAVPFGVAWVVPALTSEPPCFSVIDIPAVMPTFVVASLSSTAAGEHNPASSAVLTEALIREGGQWVPGW